MRHRTCLLVSMLVLFAGLWVPEAPAQQRIIETVSSPVRAGRVAFEHVVENCGERAELAMQRTEIGGTYW